MYVVWRLERLGVILMYHVAARLHRTLGVMCTQCVYVDYYIEKRDSSSENLLHLSVVAQGGGCQPYKPGWMEYYCPITTNSRTMPYTPYMGVIIVRTRPPQARGLRYVCAYVRSIDNCYYCCSLHTIFLKENPACKGWNHYCD